MTDNKTIAQLHNELNDAKRALKNAMEQKWIAEIKTNKMDFLEEIFEIKYQSQRYIENKDGATAEADEAMDKILMMIYDNIPNIDGVNN